MGGVLDTQRKQRAMELNICWSFLFSRTMHIFWYIVHLMETGLRLDDFVMMHYIIQNIA